MKTKTITMLLIIGALVISNVVITIISSTEGLKVVKIDREISVEKDINRDHMGNLIDKSSLTDIKENIDKTDFTKPEKVVYLYNQEKSVAELPRF